MIGSCLASRTKKRRVATFSMDEGVRERERGGECNVKVGRFNGSEIYIYFFGVVGCMREKKKEFWGDFYVKGVLIVRILLPALLAGKIVFSSFARFIIKILRNSIIASDLYLFLQSNQMNLITGRWGRV